MAEESRDKYIRLPPPLLGGVRGGIIPISPDY